jgi:AcrR family transcriptional regulator
MDRQRDRTSAAGRPRGDSRGPAKLPSGRHGLTPSFVAQNQRDRIQDGVAQAVTEVGYPALTVAEIISRAGVSRRTFYDLYKTKDDAYLEAYDRFSERLYGAVTEAFAGATTGWDRLRRALGAFLAQAASEPAFAHMCIVDVLAAGPAALERRDRAMRDFARMFDEIAGHEAAGLPPLTSEALVGGVYEVVYKRVLRGEAHRLSDLLPELYHFCLVPYLGRTASRTRYLELLAGTPEQG